MDRSDGAQPGRRDGPGDTASDPSGRSDRSGRSEATPQGGRTPTRGGAAAPRLSALAIPLHRVRRPRTGSGRRMASYTLWSAVAMFPLAALMLLYFVQGELDENVLSDPIGTALAGLQLVASSAAAVVMLFRAPLPDGRAARIAALQTIPALVLSVLTVAGVAVPPDPLVRTALAAIAVSVAGTLVMSTCGRLAVVATIAIAGLLGILLEPSPMPSFYLALFPAVFAVAVRISLWTLDVTAELEDARDARAQLAVADERLRFSRDLHDVLGRDLSTIAVTAGLMAELARRSDDRAIEKAEAIRDLAQSSLRDVRSVVRGYRSIDLDQEVRGAVSLLAASGIDVDATGGAGDVPEPHREHLAWAVREGVTNVLRHASPTRVRIALSARGLEVVNDGAHPAEDDARGTGLIGLGERLGTHGAQLTHARDGETFHLTVTLPEEIP